MTEEEEEEEEEAAAARRKEMRSTEMVGGVEPARCRVHPDHQVEFHFSYSKCFQS